MLKCQFLTNYDKLKNVTIYLNVLYSCGNSTPLTEVGVSEVTFFLIKCIKNSNLMCSQKHFHIMESKAISFSFIEFEKVIHAL